MLATEPSQVFFGEMCGASECFPNERPAKYANVSAAQVTTSAKRSNLGPCSATPCNFTAYDRGKATRRTALEEMPAAGSASTIGRRVQSVSAVMPRTNKKSIELGEYRAEM